MPHHGKIVIDVKRPELSKKGGWVRVKKIGNSNK
jgi:hypothetical protein